ncbi:hypothetical protein BTUL_0313g00020 [Botrytis tulipae]|uniref:Uncharacterized protein n=1 Tax=Botrytis tulipae TaxID=87230 RepID=A0A4Z1E4Z3_9HELO|nr:hypothetical protein BTUL_0313g00020 [Botrytis tulipae]
MHVNHEDRKEFLKTHQFVEDEKAWRQYDPYMKDRYNWQEREVPNPSNVNGIWRQSIIPYFGHIYNVERDRLIISNYGPLQYNSRCMNLSFTGWKHAQSVVLEGVEWTSDQIDSIAKHANFDVFNTVSWFESLSLVVIIPSAKVIRGEENLLYTEYGRETARDYIEAELAITREVNAAKSDIWANISLQDGFGPASPWDELNWKFFQGSHLKSIDTASRIPEIIFEIN